MEENQDFEKRLDEWKEVIKGKILMKPYCENCNANILALHFKYCTAHLLPKRENQFPSVALNLNNYLILGWQCGCHKSWDNSWDDAKKMQIFPTAIERFKLFMHEIDKNEVWRLPDSLKQILEND